MLVPMPILTGISSSVVVAKGASPVATMRMESATKITRSQPKRFASQGDDGKIPGLSGNRKYSQTSRHVRWKSIPTIRRSQANLVIPPNHTLSSMDG